MTESKRAAKVKKKEWWTVDEEIGGRPLFRYRRLWGAIVTSTLLIAILPLLVMVVANYYQYHKAFEEEIKQPIHLLASNARRSLHFFFDERLAALNFIIHEKSYDELCDQRELTRIFKILKENYADLVDVGLIDADGMQRTYVGPFGLRDKDYSKQEWFKNAMLRGRAVSDVFLGYRQFPHFALAVRTENEEGQAYVLRATLDADILTTLLEDKERPDLRDAFILSRQGVLQTPSKTQGEILTSAAVTLPPLAAESRVIEQPGAGGRIQVLGYAYITNTPFIYMVLEQRDTLLKGWFALRNQLLLFLGLSIILIVIVVLVGSTYTINKIREADDKRLALLHKVEYTAKMASIGRLAAGVAHEINNPLAIINEKAGLMTDILDATEDFPTKEKIKSSVQPIIDSVDRCAKITRRLLRFAKHIDLRREIIQMEFLIKEVLSFLDKEATYRALDVSVDVQERVPSIESDRGRLQQVFLNIINNAFGAVEDGGRVNIFIAREGDNHVSVTVRDNGVGIPPENLHNIFEPFFTTKEKHGTGLGLSITYGLVEKLGGKITVDSQVGEWTKFTVILPTKPEVKDESSEAAAG